MNETVMSEKQFVISNETERIFQKKKIKQLNGLNTNTEDQKLKELDKDFILQTISENPEVIEYFKEALPRAEKTMKSYIGAYIDEAPLIPYARIIYFLTLLKDLCEKYKAGEDFHTISFLSSYLMDELSEYKIYKKVECNDDELDFSDPINELSKETAAGMYADITQKYLKIIDLDSDDKIYTFFQLGIQYLNITRHCPCSN